MKVIKKLLTKIDIFGINFTFRYREKEKYQTSIGGFFFLLFLIAVLVMGIYYFIPFINRKNYTIVYYTMNLASTEEVQLFSSESNIAFGLSCENNDKETRKIEDLLYIETKYVYYIKNLDGTFHKEGRKLITNKCTHEDFYNKYESQFDYLSLSSLECMQNKDISVQGTYADQIFSYFEITVKSMNSSRELTDEIETFLLHNDCKLRFVYTDIIIDLDNYENPAAQYLNEIFIQLNPSLFIKRNVYFINQDFSNDDYLMFVIGEEDKPETKPLYSRYEEYGLYKGLKRFDNQPEEYDHYSKMYIRADLKKVIIKRKYQKFMEFYADASSLLIAIYEIFDIIFNYINTFYGHHSISKKIFFFKELENEEQFNILTRVNTIKELVKQTDIQKINSQSTHSNPKLKEDKNLKNFPPKKTLFRNKKSPKKENDINIYNLKDKNQKEVTKNPDIFKAKISEDKKMNSISSEKRILDNRYVENNKDDKTERYPKNKINALKRNKNKDVLINFGNNDKKSFELNESIGTNMEEISPVNEKSEFKNKIIKNSFNIFEIIISQLFKCCLCKEIKIKSNINEKAKKIIFKKMDVTAYIRNMILLDLFNQNSLDNNRKKIINFLCRPILSFDKKPKSKFSVFYGNYKERDFNKFSDAIQELVKKPKKNEGEIGLISISNEHLKDFL